MYLPLSIENSFSSTSSERDAIAAAAAPMNGVAIDSACSRDAGAGAGAVAGGTAATAGATLTASSAIAAADAGVSDIDPALPNAAIGVGGGKSNSQDAPLAPRGDAAATPLPRGDAAAAPTPIDSAAVEATEPDV